MAILGEIDPSTLVPIGTVSSILLGFFIWFLRDSARQDDRVDASTKAQLRGMAHQLDETRKDRDAYAERLERCQQRNQELTTENIRLRVQLEMGHG
jgi:hypothetical protein